MTERWHSLVLEVLSFKDILCNIMMSFQYSRGSDNLSNKLIKNENVFVNNTNDGITKTRFNFKPADSDRLYGEIHIVYLFTLRHKLLGKTIFLTTSITYKFVCKEKSHRHSNIQSILFLNLGTILCCLKVFVTFGNDRHSSLCISAREVASGLLPLCAPHRLSQCHYHRCDITGEIPLN